MSLREWQKDREDQTLEENYQRLRNEVTTKLRFSQSKYWKDQFNDASFSR